MIIRACTARYLSRTEIGERTLANTLKKTLKRTGIIPLGFVLLIIVTAAILFGNEIRSLASIRQVDEYGMFQMTYYGDYGFDRFLLTGAANDYDIEKFVTKRLLKGFPINLNVTGGGCTVFITSNDHGDVIFGRNFDFSYAPSMQVVTRPKNGYASVSTVNLSFVGYSEENLPRGLNINSFLALAAPYLPFDGMNEKGLAIALLAVSEAAPPFDENKITLNTTTAVRLLLDKAATVDEAIALLQHYNIYFSDGIDCHFLIGDARGNSALVEYYDNGMQIVTTNQPYQIASNFIAYNGINIGDADDFQRYDTVKEALDHNGGRFSVTQAVDILAEVGIIDRNEDILQWSVVYNLSARNGVMFAHRKINNLIDFQLAL